MLLGVYSITVYYSSKEAREKSFYGELQNEAIAKADLFLKVRFLNRKCINYTETTTEHQ
jgi:hypothetical protein